MNPIDLIVTVCAVLSPTTCEEQHLVFAYGGSPAQCAIAAPPYIARWIGEHPKWHAVRRRCEYPHSHERAMQAKRNPAPEPRYLVQSFRSLSAIENTASALISMPRTIHCRELG